jgi:hypothetical protein
MRAEHIQLHRLYGICTFKHIFKHDINPYPANVENMVSS